MRVRRRRNPSCTLLPWGDAGRCSTLAVAHRLPSSPSHALRHHRVIYEAVAARDPEAARAAMGAHRTKAEETLTKAREKAQKTYDRSPMGKLEVSVQVPVPNGIDPLRDVQARARLRWACRADVHSPGYWDGDDTWRFRGTPGEGGNGLQFQSWKGDA